MSRPSEDAHLRPPWGHIPGFEITSRNHGDKGPPAPAGYPTVAVRALPTPPSWGCGPGGAAWQRLTGSSMMSSRRPTLPQSGSCSRSFATGRSRSLGMVRSASTGAAGGSNWGESPTSPSAPGRALAALAAAGFVPSTARRGNARITISALPRPRGRPGQPLPTLSRRGQRLHGGCPATEAGGVQALQRLQNRRPHTCMMVVIQIHPNLHSWIMGTPPAPP
jgi:hypothetical protein